MNRPTGRPPTPIHQRFWSKVRIDNACDGSCWEWQFATDGKMGYGRFQAYGENYAHRVSWTLRHGKISRGLMVLHRCDNAKCVNPDHLFLGTGFDNMQDKVAKGRNHDITGDKNPMAYFDWGTIASIRLRVAGGETYQEVADSLGVRKAYIGKIVRQEIWKVFA